MIWLLLACSTPSTQPPSPRETGQDREEPCVDTFPVDPMVEMPIRYEDALPTLEDALPDTLHGTGLYDSDGEIHPAIQAFTPRWPLWSDGSAKQRWVYLPECAQVDSADMDHWDFPVGTRFWKEFQVDGQRVETRLIERLGPGPREWAYASYQWNADGTEATKVGPEGLQNALGTDHDIPSKAQCQSCHGPAPQGGGRPERALGFNAVQLDHPDTEHGLADFTERLTQAPTGQGPTGDDVTLAALGWLHANCGSCHNAGPEGLEYNDLDLALVWGQPLEQSGAFTTAVDRPTTGFVTPSIQQRVVPGNPQASALFHRMSLRGEPAQMPPVGTEILDPEGQAAVEAWIEALP